MPYELRHIVAEYVELQKVLVDLVIIEVSRDDVGVALVCRLLYRAELIYLVVIRDYNDAARVLARGALYAGASLYQIVYIVFAGIYVIVLNVMLYVAEGGLLSYGSYRAGLVYVLFTEDLSHIPVGHRLVFAREVEVDIRLLVPLESEECGERYVEAFLLHACPAFRTHFLRHVVAYVVFARLVRPLEMLALRADIMRCERINLSYPGHRSRKG